MKEKSFGIIPIKKQKDRWVVFLVKNKSGNHWGFPKGHAESYEGPLQAAQREMKEETNLEIKKLLRSDPFIEIYELERNNKKVLKNIFYYLAEVSGEEKIDNSEILEGIWVNILKVQDLITYPELKNLFKEVETFLLKI